MSTELKIFRKLFLALWDFHQKPFSYTGRTLEIYEKIQSHHSTIGNERELENLLPSEEQVKSGFGKTKFIYLNPPLKDLPIVPVVSMNCDFGRFPPLVRLRLVLYMLDQNEKLRAIGFRFETPEGPGNHNYYHMQLITGFEKEIPFVMNEPSHEDEKFHEPSCPEWLPTIQPAFPMCIGNPVSLILYILAGLYGVHHIAELQNNASFDQELNKYSEEMKLQLFGPTEWYWKIGIGHPMPKFYEYKSTLKPEEEFRAEISKPYTKCTISGITKEAFKKYVAQSEKKRKK